MSTVVMTTDDFTGAFQENWFYEICSVDEKHKFIAKGYDINQQKMTLTPIDISDRDKIHPGMSVELFSSGARPCRGYLVEAFSEYSDGINLVGYMIMDLSFNTPSVIYETKELFIGTTEMAGYIGVCHILGEMVKLKRDKYPVYTFNEKVVGYIKTDYDIEPLRNKKGYEDVFNRLRKCSMWLIDHKSRIEKVEFYNKKIYGEI